MWFYSDENGRRVGPVSLDALSKKLAASRSPSSVLVWREGMPGWVRADELPEIARCLPPPLPSPDPEKLPFHRIDLGRSRNQWATAGVGAALLSYVLFGWPLALVAVALCVVALRRSTHLDGAGRKQACIALAIALLTILNGVTRATRREATRRSNPPAAFGATAPTVTAPTAGSPPAPAASGAPAPTADLPPAPATRSVTGIGVAECDDYLAKFAACVDSKVPEGLRSLVREQLEQTRAQWKEHALTPAGKEGLAAGCDAAREAARASMQSYGCTF